MPCQEVKLVKVGSSLKPKIEEGYFEYSNFEFENGNFKKQSGELKAKLT